MSRRFRVLQVNGQAPAGDIVLAGSVPSRAVKKTLSALSKHGAPVQTGRKVKVMLKEITRGSPHKVTTYEVIRQKLSQPRVVTHGDVTIEHKFVTKSYKI